MAIQRITSGIIADGAIVATDIGDGIVTNDKLAGSITSDKITSVSNTAISGLIQAAQIGSANASVIDAGTLAGARLPAGSVLQVVSATYSTQTSSTTDTFIDTGLSATITPTSSSSKILILISQNALVKFGGTSDGPYMVLRLVRDSTQIHVFETQILFTGTTNESNAPAGHNYLDSPATTSAVTYKTQFKNGNSGNGTVRAQTGGSVASITLMEIAG